MLFGHKIEKEIYEPWKDKYMDYNYLRLLLKENVILMDSWSDKDEQTFVSALDSSLEKVYGFQAILYGELDRTLDDLQRQTENAHKDFDVNSFTNKLDDTLSTAQELSRFQRINYTGFTKIVQAHDRIHPEFLVKPLLNVRMRSQPFHSEDYSPFLYKSSALFQFLRDNFDVSQSLSKFSSFGEETQHQDYRSLKFWVHPEDLMEVKTAILRHIPVLVYNQENKNGDRMLLDDDDEQDDDNEPTVNCLYFDNPNLDLYKDKLDKKPNSSSLRIKWIGQLKDKPRIVVEKKIFDPSHDDYDVGEKITLKEKYLDSLVAGTLEKVVEKKKSKQKHSSDSLSHLSEQVSLISNFIREKHLQPTIRIAYKRTAFQIPGDDRVRIMIDSDLIFIREDAFDQRRPIRDPSLWHRTDIDSDIRKPYSLLRKGEHSRFPYAVMDIRYREPLTRKGFSWVDNLIHSPLVKEIPNFSKFIHGIAALFLEEEKLSTVPLWFSEMEQDIKYDPEKAYIESKKKGLETQGNEEDNMAKFKAMLQRSPSNKMSSTGANKRAAGGSVHYGDEVVALENNVPSFNEAQPLLSSTGRGSEYQSQQQADRDSLGSDEGDQSSDNYEDEEGPQINPVVAALKRVPNILKLAKLADADSEEEEIDLPYGVSKPELPLKNAGPLRVEPKVWLANERTFNRWLTASSLLSSFTFLLFSSVQKANYSSLAQFLAYTYFVITLFAIIWGYYIFNWRRLIIMARSDYHFDQVLGPLLVSVGLLFALVVNFVAGFRRIASDLADNVSVASEQLGTFYDNNPTQRAIHEFVFWLVGAA